MMAKYECFAGNKHTGWYVMQEVVADSPDDCEDAVDNLCLFVGYDDAVWAVYGDGKDTLEHVRDFREYLAKYNQYMARKVEEKEW